MKILQDIIILKLLSCFNTSQNIIFQKSSYKNRPITQGPKPLKLFDVLPSPLLDPSWVQVNQTMELFETQGTLLAPTLKGVEGHDETSGLD
jgi:hypothetical protein